MTNAPITERHFLSIIIPTFNRAVDLGLVLDQLRLQATGRSRIEIVVVDNNSTDHTAHMVCSRAAEWPVLRYVLCRDQGASAARNCGYQASHGDVCVFLDDDIRLGADFLERVDTCLAGHPDVRAFGCRVIPDWGNLQRPSWLGPAGVRTLTGGPLIDQDLGDEEGPYGEANRFAFVSAGCFVYRDLLEEAGGFRTDLGPNGGAILLGDDSELCFRIRARGHIVLYVPSITVHHPVAPGRLTKDYFRRWFTGHGRSAIRIEPDHDSPRLYGVPRYLFRQWLQLRIRALAYAAMGDAFRSFKVEMDARNVGGMITEYRRAQTSGPGWSVPVGAGRKWDRSTR